MREEIGSQWSFWRIGVMWEERGTQETRRAAAFWTCWSFDITFRGRPKRRELQQSNLDVTKSMNKTMGWILIKKPANFSNFPNSYIGGFTNGINVLRQRSETRLPLHSPVLQFGLSLYLSDMHMMTEHAFSMASAMACNVEPYMQSTSTQTLYPALWEEIKFMYSHIKDNMENLQHDYMLTWTAFEPLFYVYPVINEVVVLIKIFEKNEML